MATRSALQWGRGQISAERRREEIGMAGNNGASMGPRTNSHGEARGREEDDARGARFNGAADKYPRRGSSCGPFDAFASIGFNGAADKYSRRAALAFAVHGGEGASMGPRTNIRGEA